MITSGDQARVRTIGTIVAAAFAVLVLLTGVRAPQPLVSDSGWTTAGDAWTHDGAYPTARIDSSAVALRSPVRWGSWSGSDAKKGTLRSTVFPCPAVLAFAFAGYPTPSHGGTIALERSDGGGTIRLRVREALAGETWQDALFVVPAAWIGKPVRLSAVDASSALQGWMAITRPYADAGGIVRQTIREIGGTGAIGLAYLLIVAFGVAFALITTRAFPRSPRRTAAAIAGWAVVILAAAGFEWLAVLEAERNVRAAFSNDLWMLPEIASGYAFLIVLNAVVALAAWLLVRTGPSVSWRAYALDMPKVHLLVAAMRIEAQRLQRSSSDTRELRTQSRAFGRRTNRVLIGIAFLFLLVALVFPRQPFLHAVPTAATAVARPLPPGPDVVGRTFAVDSVGVADRRETFLPGGPPFESSPGAVVDIRGWAIDAATGASFTSVLATIDGVGVPSTVQTDLPRPDVAGALRVENQTTGFDIAIPTGGIPRGLHRIRLIRLTANDRRSVMPLTIPIAIR